MRREFEAEGIPVWVELLPIERAKRMARIAALADVAIVNTVAAGPLVRTWAPAVRVVWYLHEIGLLETMLEEADTRQAMRDATFVLAGSPLCAERVRKVREDVQVVPYGVAPFAAPKLNIREGEPLHIGVFASIERRKGQDLAIAAYERLEATERDALTLHFHGRILEREIGDKVMDAARCWPNCHYGGELDYRGYAERVAAMDALLIPSREDTLPLVSLDALSAGRVLMLTDAVGTLSYLTPGKDCLAQDGASVESIVQLFRRALQDRAELSRIADAGKQAFERHFSQAAFAERFGTLIERTTTIP